MTVELKAIVNLEVCDHGNKININFECQIITDDQLYVDKFNSSPAYLGLSLQCSTSIC